MVKVVCLIFCVIFVFGSVENSVKSDTEFEKNCVDCHTKKAPDLNNLYFRYLSKYGSQKNAKKAIFDYLQNPSKDNSLLPKQSLERHGIHQKIDIEDEKLVEFINELEKYVNIKNRFIFK